MPGKKLNGAVSSGYYGDPRASYSMQPGPSESHRPYGNGRNSFSNGVQPSEKPKRPTSDNGAGTGTHVYSVDHLVTWSVGPEHGVLTHEDGMRQLSKMEQQTGIFTMRCTLTVEGNSIHIIDWQNGELMEQFPLECVRDPVAVKDKSGMFNNITLFTVVEDAKNKNSPSEMHIFQVIDQSAAELADDIADAKAKLTTSKSTRSLRDGQKSATQPPRAESYGNIQISVQDAINKFELSKQPEMEDSTRPRLREQIRARRVQEEDSEDDVKMGVALLNRCFDEIERFVLRLKQAGRAFQELSKRKNHSKGRRHGDGMLTMRSRAPAPADFVDCFQKFKLSFNILARLRLYLHQPNSAELVHFLFTPLSLLVEASNDPRYDIRDLVLKVVTPLLTKSAIDLLQNCLSSKEYDFWMSLGEAWRTPRDKWTQGHVNLYRPKFSDGWQPSESWLEMFLGNQISSQAAEQGKRITREVEEITVTLPSPQPPPPDTIDNFNNNNNNRLSKRISDIRVSSESPSREDLPSPLFTDRAVPDRPDSAIYSAINKSIPWDDYQKNYLKELQLRSAKIYEVIQDRKANNSKELSIRKGEILEVLDDNRNWWKCGNINGDQGFVPYTLLKKYESVDAQANVEPEVVLRKPSVVPPPPPPAPVALPPPPPALPPPSNDSSGKSSNASSKRPSSTKVETLKTEPKPAPNNGSGSNNNNNNYNTNSRIQADFSHELKQRLSKINMLDRDHSTGLSVSMSAQVFIDQNSTANEVLDWLRMKGFEEYTQRMLTGYNGSEIFHLSYDALMSEFGPQEGARLVSQLKLMKVTAGYTQSGSSQLRKILQQRKQLAEPQTDASSTSSDIVFDLEDGEIASVSVGKSKRPEKRELNIAKSNSLRRY